MTFAKLTQKITCATGAIAAAVFIAAPSNAAVLGRYTFEGTPSAATNETNAGIALSPILFNSVGNVVDYPFGGRTSTGDLVNGFKDTSGTALTTNGTGSGVNGALSATSNTFEFTITPSSTSTYTVMLDKLEFDWRRSGSAGSTLNVFSNQDNYTSSLGTFTNGTQSWLIDQSVLLSGLSNNLTSPLTLRLIASGTTGTFRLDNVEVYGTASLKSTPVPTPALLPGLLSLGLGALRKRKSGAASIA
jgi:hypothetical protein